MDRRNFFRLLAGAALAPAVTHFLPPVGGWHSDVIENPTDLWAESLLPSEVNAGLFGLRYYQISTNTGNWLGVGRSPFPGKLISGGIYAAS
jgi:hypothetical protein